MKAQLIEGRGPHRHGRRPARRRRTGSSSRPATARSAPTSTRSTPTPSSSPSERAPASCPAAKPDGERIFTWTQLYYARRGARAPDRRRLGCHRRRVRVGLPRTRLEGHARLEPRPGAARGGRRRGRGDRERVHAQRHAGAQQEPRASRSSARATAVVVTLADGRTVEGSHALMAVGSVPNTDGIGLEEAGVQLTESGHIRVNRVARTSMPVDLRGRRLQRLPAAGIRRLDAGAHRRVPRDGRRRVADRAAQRDVEHLHAARGRHRRLVAEADRGRDRAGRDLQAAARVEPARQDDGHHRRLREDLRPHRIGHRHRRRRRRPEGVATSSCRSRWRSSTGSPSISSRSAFSVYPSLSGAITDAARAMHIVG